MGVGRARKITLEAVVNWHFGKSQIENSEDPAPWNLRNRYQGLDLSRRDTRK